MSEAANETIIRITDDPNQKDGVIIRNNLPSADQVDPSTLTPAQRAGAMIMRNLRSMIEVGEVGAAGGAPGKQTDRRKLMQELTKKAKKTGKRKKA